MSVSTRLTALSVMMLIVAAGLFIGIPAASQVASRGPVDNTDSEPNDDKANATVVDTDGTIEGQLLDSDHSDNYKVQLTNDGANADKITINIVFDEDLPLVSVYLRDSNGFLLEFMRDTKNTNMYAIGTSASAWYHLNITDDLQTGIYYNVTFTFTVVTFTGNGDSNNDPTEAVVIPSLPYHINTTADGDMDPYDHQDFYKVMLSRTLTKADLLVAHMTQAITAQFWVEVFTEGYVNVDAFAKESDPKAGSNQTYSYGADSPGNYYIRVWAANGSGSYDLTIDKVEIDLNDDNNKPENATPIALANNHTASFSGNIGEDLDIADYYSLDVMQGQVINTTITSHDYNESTRLPKMHIAFLESDGGTPYEADPNMTDNQLDPDGYTNASTPEETDDGPKTNYIKVFVDNVASGGGSYSVDLFTDRVPIVNQSMVQEIVINESTADKPTSDTSIELAKLFTDPDGNDVLTFDHRISSDKGMDNSSNLTITIGDDPERTVTMTPRKGEAGEIGYKGSGEITFTATDPYGMNASATFLVRVVGTNHAPNLKAPYNETGQLADPIVLVYTEGSMPEVNLLTVFGDIDGNDQLNFEVNGTSPDIEDKKYSYSSIQNRYILKGATINETFIISFHLKDNLIDHTGTISIRLDDESDKVKKAQEDRTPLEEELWFWAIDNGEPQKWSEEPVKMVLQATSPNGTPPKWSQNFNRITLKEDASVTIDFDTVTSDIDAVDKSKREYTVSNLSANISGEKIDRNNFKFTAKENWYGTVKDILLNCTDSFGLSKEHTIDIEVASVPDPPLKTGTTPAETAIVSMDEDTSKTFEITVTDVDSTLNQLDFNWTLDGQHLRTVVGNTFTYQANFDDAGIHALSVLVSDKEDMSMNISANWTMNVSNVNRPPVNIEIIEPVEDGVYMEGKLVSFRAAIATDPDPEDTVLYTWKVDGVEVHYSSIYETKGIKKGPHQIILEVSDGKVTLTDIVNITIKEAAPESEGLDSTTIGLILLFMVIIIVLVIVVARGKKEKAIKDEEPDIYAADKEAMKEAMRKADKEEKKKKEADKKKRESKKEEEGPEEEEEDED